ncbi:unnamed protein product, partial [marine sediment metagenome]
MVVSRKTPQGLPVKVVISNGSLCLSKDPSLRAERTAEVPAVSGVYRESRGEVKTLPGIPPTNLPQDIWQTIRKDPNTGQISIDQDLVGNYLDTDTEATSPSTLSLTGVQDFGRMCGSLAVVGEDEDGNRIAKRLSCRREWCSDCRLVEHRRRIASVLTKLLQIDCMGYEVITFPLEVRLFMRNPSVLALKAKQTRKLYRKMGYQMVFTRWHYFGKNGEKYHPHLNVLYDGGYLSKEQLAKKKSLIRRKLLPRSIAKRIKKDLVIHSDYTQDPKLKMRWISYVTKASFTDKSWDRPLADALKGFHNGCFAGFWNGDPKWKLTGTDKKFNALLKVTKGLHPVSGKPIVWKKPTYPWVLLLMEEPVDIGGWWYLLPTERGPPEGRLDLTNLIELPDDDD